MYQEHEFVIHGFCEDAGYALQFRNGLYYNNEFFDAGDGKHPIDYDGESIQALIKIKTTLPEVICRAEVVKLVKTITSLNLTVSTKAEVPHSTIFSDGGYCRTRK